MAIDRSNLEEPLLVSPSSEAAPGVVRLDGPELTGMIASTPEARIVLCTGFIALLGEDNPSSEAFREEIRSIEAELSEE